MEMIAAEHFKLTPAIRAHVEKNSLRLKELLPRDAVLRVFLGEPVRKKFSVLLKVRIWGKDLIAKEEGEDLYHLVDAARAHLTRQIIEEKHRWIHLRKKAGDELALSS